MWFQTRKRTRRSAQSANLAPRPSLAVEPLEARRLFAADVQLIGSSLAIFGTNGDDAAEVRTVGDQVVVGVADQAASKAAAFARHQVREIVFVGGDGNDHFRNSTALPARAWGQGGDDLLVSGAGDDQLIGGDGNDVIVASEGDDRVWGGEGDDFVIAGQGDDLVYGGGGNDQVYGEEGNDLLAGGYGDDQLFGDEGTDALYGEYGRDVLVGGDGSEYLNGGPGYDWISYGNNSPSVAGGVTESQVARITEAVFERWEDAGLQVDQLSDLQVRVADLPGDSLGWTVGRSDGSAVIWIDANAAGRQWFVDSTPLSDSEFRAVNQIMKLGAGGAAQSNIDLFTVLAHEVGHAAGLQHTLRLSVMTPSLLPGMRLVPDFHLAMSAPGRVDGPMVNPMNGQSNATAVMNLVNQWAAQQGTLRPWTQPQLQWYYQGLVQQGLNPTFVSQLLQIHQQLASQPSITQPSGPVNTALLQNILPNGAQGGPLGPPASQGVASVGSALVDSLTPRILNQALAYINQGNPQAAVQYVQYATSSAGIRDLLQAFGYHHLVNLTGSAESARMILNDPQIQLQTGQWIYNAVQSYIEQNYMRTGYLNPQYNSIANDFNIPFAFNPIAFPTAGTPGPGPWMNDPIFRAQLQAQQMQQYGQPFQMTPMLYNNGGLICGTGPYGGC